MSYTVVNVLAHILGDIREVSRCERDTRQLINLSWASEQVSIALLYMVSEAKTKSCLSSPLRQTFPSIGQESGRSGSSVLWDSESQPSWTRKMVLCRLAVWYTLWEASRRTSSVRNFEDNAHRDDYVRVLGKLDDYFVPRRHVIHKRACFHLRLQRPGEKAGRQAVSELWRHDHPKPSLGSVLTETQASDSIAPAWKSLWPKASDDTEPNSGTPLQRYWI